MEIEITKAVRSRLGDVDFNNLGFGQFFSDHMFMVNCEHGNYAGPQIVPFANIEVSPSLCSLHYGQTVFEGLKAFHGSNGTINLFRPEKYHERFNRSCSRLCIPPVGLDMFLEGIRQLVKLDSAWVPKKRGSSLYIRPFIFATDNLLGVHVSDSYLFMIILSPVSAYYKEGLDPVKLMTPGEYVRAVRGGLGEAKTPANYASSLLPAEEAKKNGFTQVLWLDAVEKTYIEEVGTMNIMFLINDELITPPLEGSILSGVTRDSVIELARHWGIAVRERKISIEEVFGHARTGGLHEAFGTGTAAVISPVGWIKHGDDMITINGGRIGPFSQRLYDEITGIQYGERHDPFGWRYELGA